MKVDQLRLGFKASGKYPLLIFCLILFFPIITFSQEMSIPHEKFVKEKILKGESIVFTEDDMRSGRNHVQAEWIIEAIRAGKSIDITRAIIEGVLDFRQITEPVPIDACPNEIREAYEKVLQIGWEVIIGKAERCVRIIVPIAFKNCQFKEIIQASVSKKDKTIIAFEKGVDFGGSKFLKPPHFIGAFFKEKADFSSSCFQNGANFSQAKFHCDANFSFQRHGDKTYFKGKTYFTQAVFRDKALFSEGKFLGEDTDFKSTEFYNETNFGSVEFGDKEIETKTDFSSVYFYGQRTSFSGAKFWGTADFTETRVKGSAIFSHEKEITEFHKEAKFTGAIFGNETYFISAIFNGKADFSKTLFGELASFFNVRFYGQEGVNFERARFTGIADFQIAEFGKEVMYSGRVINKEPINFEYAIFKDVWFVKAKFYKDTSFRNVNFHKAVFSSAFFWQNIPANIDFEKKPIGGFKRIVEKKKYQGISLSIEGIVFDSVQGLTWEQIALPLCQEYFKIRDDKIMRPQFLRSMAQLQDNFRRLGLFSDANAIYYERKVIERQNSNFAVNFFSFVFFDLPCGYGTKFLNVIIFAGVVIGFSFFIYLGLVIRTYTEGKKCFVCMQDEVSQQRSNWCWWHAFYISVLTFGGLGFGVNPDKEGYRIIIVVERALGWYALALFIYTLTNSLLT